MLKKILTWALALAVSGPALAQITLTSPNGGQTLAGCSSVTVSWTKGAASSDNQAIDYSLNGGGSYIGLVASVSSAGSSNGSASISLPSTPSTRVLFKVRDLGGSATSDVSNAVNTITSANPQPLHVTYPNGGETVYRGSTQRIKWTASSPGRFLVSRSINGTTWLPVGSTSNNYFDWNIQTSGPRHYIRVMDSVNSCRVDYSDTTFRILTTTPAIGLTSLNGGESLTAGDNVQVSWAYSGVTSEFVFLEFSPDSGSTWQIIEDSIPLLGSYGWTVPNVNTDHAQLRLTVQDNASISDVSNGKFSVTAAFVDVTAPASGIVVGGCTNVPVTFNARGATGFYVVAFSTDGGKFYQVLAEPSLPTSGNAITYSVKVPSIATSKGKFLVYDKFNPTARDTSSGFITVATSSTPTIKVLSPNGGEVLPYGPFNITWQAPGIRKINFYVSTDGGVTTYFRDSLDNTGSFLWNAPPVQSSQYLIRLEDKDNPCNTDMSDGLFAVTNEPFIQVVTPNGGEKYRGNTVQQIKWRSGNLGSSTVDILLSRNSGSTFENVALGVPNTGTANWTTPFTNNTFARILIRQTGHPEVSDVSDANFNIFRNIAPTVDAGPDKTILLPVSSVMLTATASDLDGNVPANGYLWTEVSGPNTATITGATSATATVSGLAEGTYLFRVRATDNEGGTAEDLVNVVVITNQANTFWSNAIRGGSTDRDRGDQIVRDNNGNLYIVGHFTGVMTFNNVFISSATPNLFDAFVACFDSNLVCKWMRSAGGPGEDEAYDITIDPISGRLYIGGLFNQTASFGPTTLTSRGRLDAFVSALDLNGNWLWTTQMGGPGEDQVRSLALGKASGDVLAAGSYQKAAIFGSITLNSVANSRDCFVARLDKTTGALVFAKSYGGPANDEALAIAANGAGGLTGFAATGYFAGTATFGSQTLVSQGGNDIWTGGWFEDGTFIAARPDGGPGDDVADAIVVSEATSPLPSHTYVGGYFNATLPLAPGIILTSAGQRDAFISVSDPNGQVVNAFKLGTTRDDNVFDLYLRGSKLFASGYFTGALNVGGANIPTYGEKDIFVSRHELDASANWLASAGSSSDDYGNGVVADEHGNTYMVGWCVNRALFGDILTPRLGYWDVVLAKHNSSMVSPPGLRRGLAEQLNAQPQAGLSVVPNPVAFGSRQATIRFSNLRDADLYEVRVMDVTGRTVLTESAQLPGGTAQINLSIGQLPAGTYQIVAQSQAQRMMGRLVLR